MNFFGKLSYILGKKNKIASYFILFLLITSALMEAIGLGLVLPFLSLLYDVKDYRIYNYFNSIFKNLSKIEIIEIFLIIILIIFFIKNLILTLCSVKESQFVWKFRKYLSENIIEINQHIPQGVKLVAVSKTKPISDIEEAYNIGQRVFGENKVQEMEDKFRDLQFREQILELLLF